MDYNCPMALSSPLARLVGTAPGKKLSAYQVTKRVWAHIKKNKLKKVSFGYSLVYPDEEMWPVFGKATFDGNLTLNKMGTYLKKHMGGKWEEYEDFQEYENIVKNEKGFKDKQVVKDEKTCKYNEVLKYQDRPAIINSNLVKLKDYQVGKYEAAEKVMLDMEDENIVKDLKYAEDVTLYKKNGNIDQQDLLHNLKMEYNHPMALSPPLARLVGVAPNEKLSKCEVTKRVWAHIRNNLEHEKISFGYSVVYSDKKMWPIFGEAAYNGTLTQKNIGTYLKEHIGGRWNHLHIDSKIYKEVTNCKKIIINEDVIKDEQVVQVEKDEIFAKYQEDLKYQEKLSSNLGKLEDYEVKKYEESKKVMVNEEHEGVIEGKEIVEYDQFVENEIFLKYEQSEQTKDHLTLFNLEECKLKQYNETDNVKVDTEYEEAMENDKIGKNHKMMDDEKDIGNKKVIYDKKIEKDADHCKAEKSPLNKLNATVDKDFDQEDLLQLLFSLYYIKAKLEDVIDEDGDEYVDYPTKPSSSTFKQTEDEINDVVLEDNAVLKEGVFTENNGADVFCHENINEILKKTETYFKDNNLHNIPSSSLVILKKQEKTVILKKREVMENQNVEAQKKIEEENLIQDSLSDNCLMNLCSSLESLVGTAHEEKITKLEVFQRICDDMG